VTYICFFSLNTNRDYAVKKGWTKETAKRLLYTIDHFCEMVFSFASKFKFLDASQSIILQWFESDNSTEESLRDDPTDPIMIEKVLPYIRNVSQIILLN